MTSGSVGKGRILLGSTHYPIVGPVQRGRLDRFAGQVRSGPREYGNETVLSSWTISDRRGGIGIDEIDESIHLDKTTWWSDANIDYDGHLTLGRLATEIAVGAFPASPISARPALDEIDFETAGSWTNETINTNGVLHGTNGLQVGAATTVYQDAATWATDWQGDSFTFFFWGKAAAAAELTIEIDDGVGTTASSAHSGGNQHELMSVTRTLDGAATRLRCQIKNVGAGAHSGDCAGLLNTYVGTTVGPKENFNGELYIALDSALCKLTAGRAGLTYVQGFPDTITSLKTGINGRLYIGCGDSQWYYWMDTSEAVKMGVDSAYWINSWDSKCYIFD